MQRQLALGSLDHTVYFRNKPRDPEKDLSWVSSSVIIVFFSFKQGILKDAMVTGGVLRVFYGYTNAVKDEKSMAQTEQAVWPKVSKNLNLPELEKQWNAGRVVCSCGGFVLFIYIPS